MSDHSNERTWLTIEPLSDGRCLIKGIVNDVNMETDRDQISSWGEIISMRARTTMSFNMTGTPYYLNLDNRHRNKNTEKLRVEEFSQN